MSAFLDSSVLVAALVSDELKHADSLALVLKGGNCIYSHALLETFSTLTGGKLGVRVTPDLASQMISVTILPRVSVVELTATEIMDAISVAQSYGVRGGCVYDYMHLLAARKSQASVIYTLNIDDFQHLRRPDDPEIRLP
ncbi:MAG: PIN domain-containing protein [Verrucomicrobia bacterium]|nr:PIN domain-containing protein [Verrucomicrobiota bacterium]